MAYTSGFTAVTGATFTAAQYNTNVRDNFSAIWVGTTAGDIDYYTGATGKSRLAISTARRTLRVNAGATAPEWGGFIGAKAMRNATQPISNNTVTECSFDNEMYDTDNFFSVGTPTRFIVPYDGLYLMAGLVSWAGQSAGYRMVKIYGNQTSLEAYGGENISDSGLVGGALHMPVIGLQKLAAADQISMVCYQNSGVSVNTLGTEVWLSVAFLGPN